MGVRDTRFPISKKWGDMIPVSEIRVMSPHFCSAYSRCGLWPELTTPVDIEFRLSSSETEGVRIFSH